MGQSLSIIPIHLVFGTRFRSYFVPKELKQEMHAMIIDILEKLNCQVIVVNSMPDHVHVLFLLNKNIGVSKVAEHIKKDTSRWLNRRMKARFRWQGGYAAFAVHHNIIDRIAKYIRNQEQHHRKKTHREEIEQLTDEFGLSDYNTDFYWTD